jgi:hypothetical protein
MNIATAPSHFRPICGIVNLLPVDRVNEQEDA